MKTKPTTERLPTVYSGPRSVKFWDRVNALPAPRRWELYSCGVLLQELEARVLRWLREAEEQAATHRRRKK